MKEKVTEQKTLNTFSGIGIMYLIGIPFLGIYYIVRLMNANNQNDKQNIKIEINKCGKIISIIILIYSIICGILCVIK